MNEGSGNAANMLDDETERRYGRAMDSRRKKMPLREALAKASEDVGGEPLEGSGFEDEVPDSEFSEKAHADPERGQ
jgi:hypothetical protein